MSDEVTHLHATAERPHTDAQLRKLWAEARERGWHPEQVYGRANEINSDADVVGLRVLDTAQMSELIDALTTESPWLPL